MTTFFQDIENSKNSTTETGILVATVTINYKDMENIIKRHGYIFTQNDFIPALEQCPVCGAPKHQRELFSYINKKLGIHYLKCNNCFTISSSHYAKNEVLDDFYKHYYQLMQREDKRVTIHDWKGFAEHIVKYCRQTPVLEANRGGGKTVLKFLIMVVEMEPFHIISH